MKLDVYTDGSGTTGGPAGIAYVALEVWSASDGALNTRVFEERAWPVENATNQQAEILAAALALVKLPHAEITIYSDSEYLVKGWNDYVPWWLEHDWTKKTGGKAKNIAHWQRLLAAAEKHESVRFVWLRGHDGHEHNERADKLAGEAREIAKGVGTPSEDRATV